MLQINTEWGYPAFLLMSVPQLVNLETLFLKKKKQTQSFLQSCDAFVPCNWQSS